MDHYFKLIKVPFDIIEYEIVKASKRVEIRIKEGTLWDIRESIPPLLEYLLLGDSIELAPNMAFVIILLREFKPEIEPHFKAYLTEEYKTVKDLSVSISFEYVDAFEEDDFSLILQGD